MLDLQSRVHLEERDGSVRSDQKLARAGADVAGLAKDGLRRLVEQRLLLVGQERRGRLFDQLLVTTLEGAVAGGDDDHVAVRIREALRLDVAGLVEVLLDEALAAAECGNGLAGRRLELLGDLVAAARDLESASAAAEGSLDRDRQAVLVGEGDDLVGGLDRVQGARRKGCSHALGDVARLHLVAQCVDGCGGGADPGQARVDDGLRERRVLGEEAIARVHRVGARAARCREDLVDDEVGLGAGCSLERVGLVGQAHVARIPIGVGVDGDGSDACVFGCTDDSDCDLAAVGDQDLCNAGHDSRFYKPSHECPADSSTRIAKSLTLPTKIGSAAGLRRGAERMRRPAVQTRAGECASGVRLAGPRTAGQHA